MSLGYNLMVDNSTLLVGGASPYGELCRLRLRAVEVRLAVLLAVDASPQPAPPGAPLSPLGRTVAPEVLESHVDTLTVVYLFGVVDAYVQTVGKTLRPVVERRVLEIETGFEQRMRRIIARNSQRAHAQGAALSDDFRRAIMEFASQQLQQALSVWKKGGSHRGLPLVERWESILRPVALGEPQHRPLPEDLRDTLNELEEVRHVITHRMGRMDSKAMAAVREGPWTTLGEEVMITPELYRRYIAALWVFPDEINQRVLLGLGAPAVFDLADWRQRVPSGG